MPRFGPPEALARLCTGGAHADSVELKALLRTPADRAAEVLTGRPSPTWSERRTYLLDTEALDLLRAGVEIRLRRRARGRYDLAVSARRTGTTPDRTAPRGVRVELDVVPGEVWQDIEVRREVDPGEASHVVARAFDPRELLSTAQRAWALRGGHEPVDDGALKELTVHGPLVVHRVKVTAAAPGLRADLEHFRFPSGREMVELSTHCDPHEVSAAAAAFERLLDDRALHVADGYRTKTEVWRDELGL
ncbi:hypothetical protein [Actinomycetospora sp. TBRC 11914]|uniref:hypothetical protein n=1 Tax=Actinomycetospora sp. TBRC 11914 TaxID=2729387 RepID=UPI00145D19B6|nr:hypothetical protein [Actinomycetospora sp. TBRC 11914]NMO90893.1 hypothetical protein [Actinomycetospora sp. TBRC 11914]